MSNEVRCIVILSAMSSEIKPVRRALRLGRSPESAPCKYQGTYQQVKVLATTTNMGLMAAERKTKELFVEYGDAIDHVFVVGIAGSNHPKHKIGEVVPIETVIDERDGVSRHPVNLSNREPGVVLFSTDALIHDSETVTALRKNGASLVDMESGAIAAVCEQFDCPVSIIRAVSDKMEDGYVDGAIYQLANEDGSPKIGKSMRYVLRNPLMIRSLAALAMGSRKAIRSSTDELLRSINALLLV